MQRYAMPNVVLGENTLHAMVTKIPLGNYMLETWCEIEQKNGDTYVFPQFDDLVSALQDLMDSGKLATILWKITDKPFPFEHTKFECEHDQ